MKTKEHNLNIPESLDMKILEYASKKNYRQMRINFIFKIAAIGLISLAVLTIFSVKFVEQRQIPDNSFGVNEYDLVKAEFTKLMNSYDADVNEISKTIETEMAREFVALN